MSRIDLTKYFRPFQTNFTKNCRNDSFHGSHWKLGRILWQFVPKKLSLSINHEWFKANLLLLLHLFHLPKHEPYCLPEARSFGQRPRKLHCWSSVDRHQTQMLVIVERKTVADHFPIETSITFGFVLILLFICFESKSARQRALIVCWTWLYI